MHVIQCSAKHPHICHLDIVRPSQGNVFYLRAILQNHPVKSFTDALTVDNIKASSFQEAATMLGLFVDQNKAQYMMQEAVSALHTPAELCFLFLHLLINDCIIEPLALWQEYMHELSKDFMPQCSHDIHLVGSHALQSIGDSLEEHGKVLNDYGLPQPTLPSSEVLHEWLKWNPLAAANASNAHEAYSLMTDKQHLIFDKVIHCAVNNTPLCAFINRKVGRGKTFLINAICNKLQSLNHIVLPTATATSATLLYPGG
ncbi:hypothetical protein PISMIDRAFT_100910 [Pisolithus microcarpus 441]|uniref:ATP-dependent DNA helicase n=1 Tax=Pisolithus microcarpus 441 TaxID=765257 RepID=A0A0C9YEA4_9AGAM|nr:hypothetical protein BKA83DRAFT_100910 [Pisolithus microcarpus]KIK23155.1 hypothetical protein PISMIDRAFT_100910 [Pisolithus microcarpus 441]